MIRFGEKDFMRGIAVPKSSNLLNFLNDYSDVSSYSFKLGCLHSSVNLFENEFIKVLVSKIDHKEL